MCELSAAQVPKPATPDIATDRPAVTDSSVVVPAGSLQFENGMTWTRDHGSQTLDSPETLMRLGILKRTEVRLVVPNYLSGLSGSSSDSGFSDIALGMKQQLGPLRGGFDLSAIVSLSLPTGSDGVSTHGFDPSINFPWSKGLKAGWSIGGMQSAFWHTENHRRNAIWEPTFYVDKSITNAWDVFAEYAGDFFQRGGSKQVAHFGTTYKVTSQQQLDFHFGIGLSQAAVDRFFAMGYSFRFDLKPNERATD